MTANAAGVEADVRKAYYKDLMNGQWLPKLEILHAHDRLWIRLQDTHPNRPVSLAAASLVMADGGYVRRGFGIRYCVRASRTGSIGFDTWSSVLFQLAQKFRPQTSEALRRRLVERGFQVEYTELLPTIAYSHKTIHRLRGRCFPESQHWADLEFAVVAADGSRFNIAAPQEVLEHPGFQAPRPRLSSA